MSVNCIRCVKNRRTGHDLLCDVCRSSLKRSDLARGGLTQSQPPKLTPGTPHYDRVPYRSPNGQEPR